MTNQVLVLRDQPLSDASVTRIEALLAWQVNQLSCIDIVATPTQIPALPFDGAIVISRNAVKFATEALQQSQREWPQTRWFAVGPSTARALANATRQPVTAPFAQFNSETLLRLPELQRLQGQRWLLLRGEGGRELLSHTLQARGAEVAHWATYRRQPRQQQLSETELAAVKIIVVTSAEQLGNFLASLPAQALLWLSSRVWVVPSERVLALLPGQLQQRAVLARSALDSDLAQAVIEQAQPMLETTS